MPDRHGRSVRNELKFETGEYVKNIKFCCLFSFIFVYDNDDVGLRKETLHSQNCCIYVVVVKWFICVYYNVHANNIIIIIMISI